MQSSYRPKYSGKYKGRRPLRAPYARRSYAQKRVYRKRGGAMSQKRILNLTSRKKKDTMLNYTNITSSAQQGSGTYAVQPAIIVGGQNQNTTTAFPIVWCATGRDLTTDSSNTQGVVADAATRTATTCYMRGLSEKIEIQVTDGLPWQWRRICFTYKGFNNAAPNSSGFSLVNETTNGYVRLLNMLPSATYINTVEGLMFRGSKSVDWTDPMTAPLDPTRITVKYDKTITIASGNEQGCIRKFNRWHGMNKNLVYADDENAGTLNEQFYSTQSKAGMGDYIVVDYFQARKGATSSQQLSFGTTATLYWHEK